MLVSTSYNTENILGVDAISSKKYSRVQEQTQPSGDTVDISEEAKNLYSQMIHKYDHASSGGSESGESSAESGEQGGASGGAGGAESSNSAESIKNQIQSLKSQMAALASQIGTGADAAAISKMNSLQAQIAALEAQLNELA